MTTPREIVLEQIHHHETTPVPYTLYFDGDVAERLTAHYGSDAWRERLTEYIISCGDIPTMAKEPINDSLARDLLGSVWRMDMLPSHLEEPAMKAPSFDGYDLPSADVFAVPDLKEKAEKAIEENPDGFRVIWVPWGLWESSWGLRGFENALMDCVAEPDFFEELLDRLTDLFLTHVAQCADVPADAIMFGDDWGDQRGVIVGTERWRKFFKSRYARIYEAAHAQGKIVMSHCCGSIAEIMPDVIEIG